MNLLFLSLQYDKAHEAEYLRNSKIGLQGAINTFQWNLVDGFLENEVTPFILNTLPVGTFPISYKKLLLKSRNWGYKGMSCHEVGYLNLPILKQWLRQKKIKKELIKWVENVQGPKTILAYSLYLPFEKAMIAVKKRHPEIKLCFIVADLPCQYGILPKKPMKSYLFKKYGQYTLDLMVSSDAFVLLTEQMKEPLHVGDRPYVVVEGICSAGASLPLQPIPGKKVILYTGTLHYQFGIGTLLEAFSQIDDPTYELWICGAGEAEAEIRSRAALDHRIHFYGYVTKEEALRLQQQATLLVNPRTNEGEYTKYSFPSKTIEYMASGVPVLMYKLDGIPDEYDNYIYYVEGNSTDYLRAAIESVCNKTKQELDEFGLRAREFVLNEKNCVMQTKKMLAMIVK